MTVEVGPGLLYLIDTSAHARLSHPEVRRVIAGLVADGAAATCVTVMHYDADLEQIAASTGQPQAWVTPKGTID